MQNNLSKPRSPNKKIQSILTKNLSSQSYNNGENTKFFNSGSVHFKSPFNDDFVSGLEKNESSLFPTIRNSFFSPRATTSSQFKQINPKHQSSESKGKEKLLSIHPNNFQPNRFQDIIIKYTNQGINVSDLTNLEFYFSRMNEKIEEIKSIALNDKQYIRNINFEVQNRIASTVENIFNQFNILLSKKEAKLNELKDSNQKYDHLEQQNVFKDPKLIENKEPIESNEIIVLLNKLKLENKLYNEKVKSLVESQNTQMLIAEIENIKINHKKSMDGLEYEIKRRQRAMETFELKYLGIKGVNEKLEEINQSNLQEITKLKDKIIHLGLENSRIAEEKNMYRERSQMQYEEFRVAQLNLNEFKFNFIKLREMMKLEKLKYEKMMEERQKIDQTQGLDGIIGDFSILNYLKDVFIEKDNFGKTLQTQKSYQEYSETRAYSIQKPSFKHFTSKKIKTSEDPNFNFDFLALIRAIFDSKFYELQYSMDYTHFSRFPEFVYSWTGKFIFCSKQRNTRLADLRDPDPDILRTNIIKLLANKKSYKLWDCIIFKEFLDEHHARDELAYFLFCRNLLFKGPQMNDSSASFNFIYYVKFEWAEKIIEHLLKDKYTKEVLNMIRSKLRNKMILKNKIEVIDSGFILRILLEEYKREKGEKMNILKKAIEIEPKIHVSNSRYSISFESFKNVITNYFPESLEIEKGELFRKTWLYGNGFVDAESILITLNEENFFLKSINFKDFKTTPLLDEKYEYQSSPQNEIYKFFTEKFEKLNSGFDATKNSIFHLGVERMMSDYFDHEKVIRSNFQAQNTEYRINNMVIWISSLFIKVFRINHIYLCSQVGKEDSKILTFSKSIWSLFDKVFIDIINEQNAEILKDFEKNHKSRRLQKFFKSKLSTWYKLMSFIIKNKISKLQIREKK